MLIVIGSILIQVEMSDTLEVFGDMLASTYLLVMVANAGYTDKYLGLHVDLRYGYDGCMYGFCIIVL